MKYGPDFPTVTIPEAHPGRVMTPEQLEALGLVAAPEPVKATTLEFTRRFQNSSEKAREWPSYDKALAGAPQNQVGTGPDRSKADYGGPTLHCSANGASRIPRQSSWK